MYDVSRLMKKLRSLLGRRFGWRWELLEKSCGKKVWERSGKSHSPSSFRLWFSFLFCLEWSNPGSLIHAWIGQIRFFFGRFSAWMAPLLFILTIDNLWRGCKSLTARGCVCHQPGENPRLSRFGRVVELSF